MEFGLGVLGLGSDAFWHLTPRELAAALRGRHPRVPVSAPPGRADLARMMARFPD